MISLPDLEFNLGRKGTGRKKGTDPCLLHAGACLKSVPGKLRARRALLIGAGRAAVYEWRDNVAVRCAVFAAGEEGRQGFRRYLAETPGIPFYLLVDVADEEYRHETVPHVARRDRQALLRRKAGRLFKDTGYCFFRVTGRETTGRKDDRVLLGALADPGVVRQWTALLDEARMPLAGICSLPLFSGQLLKTIAGRVDGCRVLVSMQSISGLRQTSFDNGEFRFSRLVQTPRAERESLPGIIGDEVEKVLRYLDSRRTDAPAAPVHVHFLFAGDLLQELKTVLKQQDSVTYHFCDLRGLADKNASRESVADPYGDAFFMQQLLRLRPANVYAGAAERRWFFLRRLRAGFAATGFALLLGGAGWSLLNIYSGVALYLAGNAAEEEAHRYAALYEPARKRLPQTPVDPSGLKTAVKIAEHLALYKTSPIGMVTVLGRSLQGSPSIRLNSMSWMVTGNPDTAFAGGADRAQIPPAMGDPGAARSLYQAALVKGRLEPFNGNYRDAMDAVNRFAEDLRDREAVSGVDIVALPLDTSSGAELQGNTQSLQRQAEFTLKAVLEYARDT